jgi:hypothetical protein
MIMPLLPGSAAGEVTLDQEDVTNEFQIYEP